jgi:hypothetical protein
MKKSSMPSRRRMGLWHALLWKPIYESAPTISAKYYKEQYGKIIFGGTKYRVIAEVRTPVHYGRKQGSSSDEPRT